jgi:hypothetical protein
MHLAKQGTGSPVVLLQSGTGAVDRRGGTTHHHMIHDISIALYCLPDACIVLLAWYPALPFVFGFSADGDTMADAYTTVVAPSGSVGLPPSPPWPHTLFP